MVELTRNFAASTGIEATPASVTAAAVDLVEGVDYADVMLVEDGQFQSIAPSAPLVTELDAVQLNLAQGPCLEAAVADSMICSNDLRTEPRWPQFAVAAVSAGVYSMLILLYGVDDQTAFDILRRQSQKMNVKVRALAGQLVSDYRALSNGQVPPHRSVFDETLTTVHERIDPDPN
jgi:hypothetical protein